MIYDCCYLNVLESLAVNEVLYSLHRPVVAACNSPLSVMRITKSVNADRYRTHFCSCEHICNVFGDKRCICRHAPVEPLLYGISQKLFKIRIQKRLSACDAKLHPLKIEVLLNIIQNGFKCFLIRSVS